MDFNFLFLFLVSMGGGAIAFFTPKFSERTYRMALVFSGAFLFAITIVHIMPELFNEGMNPELLGIFVLAGFFIQQGLETFTQGVEHGHLHEHHGSHSVLSGPMLLIALSLHAFMEGMLLSHPSDMHPVQDSGPLLWGIILHKIPAAFALMTVIRCQDSRMYRALLYLFIFSMASPAGMAVGDIAITRNLVSSQVMACIFALVSGNFLHISTTIVFESNEGHRLNYSKWFIAILGAGIAVLVEFL